MTTSTPPATPGLLPQLRAEWTARGWDPAILDLFRMEDPPGDGGGEGGGGGQGGSGSSSPPPATPPVTPNPTNSGNGAGQPDLGALQSALDNAADSGRSEALQPLMAAIGVDSPEALQQWVTDRQAEIDAGKDEATRAREAAEREAAEARAQAAQASSDALAARMDAALATAGAPADNWDDLRRLVDVEAGADRDTVMAAVEAVKAKYPALFTATGEPGKPKPPPHTIPPRQPGGTPPATGIDAGRERARRERERRQTFTKDDLVSSFSPKPSPFAN